MQIGLLQYYFIIINILSMGAYLLSIFLRKKQSGKNIDMPIVLLSVAGGSLGVLLMICLFDRKAIKENMLIRVVVICSLVVQIMILFKMYSYRFRIYSYHLGINLLRSKIFLLYLILINIATFSLFAIDKYNAIKQKRRIRIVTLLGFSFAGGTIGGMIAMYTLRHKTQKKYFTIGMPAILIMQLLFFVFI